MNWTSTFSLMAMSFLLAASLWWLPAPIRNWRYWAALTQLCTVFLLSLFAVKYGWIIVP
jgi:hypothetical protein